MWTKVLILLQKDDNLIVTGPHHLPKGRLGTSGNDWFQKYFCLYLLTYYFIKYFLRGTSKALKMFRKCIKIKQTNLSGWVFTFLFDFDCCISSLGTLSTLHFPFIQLVTFSHLICTFISENQGLEKLRSVSNLRKISSPAHLIFFFQ